MKVSLKNIIVPSIPLAVLLVMSCIGLWVSSFLGERLATPPTQNSFIVNLIESILAPNSALSNLASISFTLLNAFLLAQINNRFTIIRTRTFLPIFVFLLLMGSWSQTHSANGSHFALTLIIFALFNFFSMSHNRQASEQAFMGSFLISLSSLYINSYIFIIPVCWFGFMIFQSFSLRTFLASIFGTITPWILYISVRYLLDPHLDLSHFFVINPNIELDISTIQLPSIIYSAALIIILIISVFSMNSISNNDAIRTRNKLNFLILLIISLSILLILFRGEFSVFLPPIALIYSLLFSHPFTLKQNNFHGILFIIFCFINIAFVISKYIPI